MDGIDGETMLDEEIVAAVAVGASVFELWSTVSGIAVVWFLLADGVVSCYRLLHDDGVSRLIFKFQTGAGVPRRLFSFIRPAHSGAHAKKKMQE